MKHIMEMRITSIDRLNECYALIKLTPDSGLKVPTDIRAGQFVQIQIPDSPATFLRRPISVNFVDYGNNQLWLLVRDAGAGTHHLVSANPGDVYSIILPLGNGFTIPADCKARVLLVGGGVGVAPLLYLGKQLRDYGFKPEFALGARSADGLLQLDEFAKYGNVHVTTEDGSYGEQGFVVQHSRFSDHIDYIACCGPTPMMRAVARIAADKGIECEVSLENMMACGIGACLCCVEDTADGNVCVCTDGPVFNVNKLKWQI